MESRREPVQWSPRHRQALSALKRYGIYVALYLFYRAAFYKKVNDRYDKKRQMFETEMCKKYWPRFLQQGASPSPISPWPAPARSTNSTPSTWGPSNVTTVAGTNGNAALSYDVAITWVDNSQYVSPAIKGNAESAPSAIAPAVSVATANVLQISIAGLNAPNGLAPLNVQLGQSLVVPGKASGWNVYVGSEGGTLYLQNATPIGIATLTYTPAGAPVLSGYQADNGQFPDALLTQMKTLMRG